MKSVAAATSILAVSLAVRNERRLQGYTPGKLKCTYETGYLYYSTGAWGDHAQICPSKTDSDYNLTYECSMN